VLNQAAPLPSVQSTELFIGSRLFTVVAIERIAEIHSKMIHTTQEDEKERLQARQCLEDRGVGTAKGIFWNTMDILPMTIILPKILDTVYVGMVKHLMDWVMSFIEQHSRIDKFSQC